MLGGPEALYALARRTLLDVLEILGAHRDAVILVGAQAIYLHTGEAHVAVAPTTKDADLALDPARLAPEPRIEEVLRAAGFESPPDQIGIWRHPGSKGQVDLLVPEALSGKRGRRAARLEVQGDRLARRTPGLEGVVVDNGFMEIGPLEESDERHFEIRVAGPAALLVAKLYKLGERRDQPPGRLNDKDALDVLRLLRGMTTGRLAERLRRQLEAELSSAVARDAIEILHELFGSEASLGTQMAVRALDPLEDPAVVAASCVILANDLLGALSS